MVLQQCKLSTNWRYGCLALPWGNEESDQESTEDCGIGNDVSRISANAWENECRSGNFRVNDGRGPGCTAGGVLSTLLLGHSVERLIWIPRTMPLPAPRRAVVTHPHQP